MSRIRIVLLTIIALFGMAGNSLLTRAVLGEHLIGPLPFTTIRLTSGATILLVLIAATRTRPKLHHVLMPFMLFLYALAFAYGYEHLGAATGTLFLFFAIQATMLAWEIRGGRRLSKLQWTGSGLTLVGLWVLVGGISDVPKLLGIGLMLGAGTAWAAYSILGKASSDDLATTTANFIYSGFAAIIFLAIYAVAEHWHHEVVHITIKGIYYSMIIGAITSALIYVLWYILIKELAGVTSAVIQMLVPLIVVLSSAPLLGEKITIRILLAGSAMIFGILLVTLPQENKKGFSNKSGR